MARREFGVGSEWQPDASMRQKQGSEPSSEVSSLVHSLTPLVATKRGEGEAGDGDRREDECSLDSGMRALALCQNMVSRTSESTNERPWSSLLTELLELISSHLPLSNLPNFALACKHWNSCTLCVYPADITPLLLSNRATIDGLIRYYSPYFNKYFVIDNPSEVLDGEICSSTRDGWLTVRTPNGVGFANPISGKIHKLPDFDIHKMVCCISWGQPPYNCHIFCIGPNYDDVKIVTWDAEGWREETEYENEQPFEPSVWCNPVLRRGLLYCLSEGGNLGVYDPGKGTWAVLEKPNSFGFSYKHCYLVESEGELLSVLTGKNGPPVHVFRLNEMEMEWEKIDTLGGRALFIGTIASFSKTSPLKSMENKIYFPRFYGEAETVHAELRNSDGRLFFVPKGQPYLETSGVKRTKDSGSALCYDLESEKMQEFVGSKFLFQHVWVDFGFGN